MVNFLAYIQKYRSFCQKLRSYKLYNGILSKRHLKIMLFSSWYFYSSCYLHIVFSFCQGQLYTSGLFSVRIILSMIQYANMRYLAPFFSGLSASFGVSPIKFWLAPGGFYRFIIVRAILLSALSDETVSIRSPPEWISDLVNLQSTSHPYRGELKTLFSFIRPFNLRVSHN